MPATITTRNSIEHVNSYSDWFLPSKDELNAMYTELHLYGVGGFGSLVYWSSTESGSDSCWNIRFFDGVGVNSNKTNANAVRASRAFTSITVYALRDNGPAGGLIFWKSGNDYLEAASSNQSISKVWSNITNVEIGVTAQGTAIGTGQANTTAIIGQAGHTDSAAKLCDDLVVQL